MQKISGVDRIKLAIHQQLGKTEYLPYNFQTFCNIFVYNVLLSFGLNKPFWNEEKKRIMLANEMYDVLTKNYTKSKIEDVLLPSNILYIASCRGKEHGHIAIIYPSLSRIYSNKWSCFVPLVANVGIECGIMGLNWAFSDLPDIFAISPISEIDKIYGNN